MNIDKELNADNWMLTKPRIANELIIMMRRLLDAMGEDAQVFADYCTYIDQHAGEATDYERGLVDAGNALSRDFIIEISKDLIEAAGGNITLESERLSTVDDLRHIATALNQHIELRALYEEWEQ